MTDTLHEEQNKFTIISRLILLRIRNIGKNQNKHFFSENLAVYAIMYSIVEPEKPQKTIWRMRIARWIRKAINTHSNYVIFTVCLLQQWLHERELMLRYTYITCLVLLTFPRQQM
jgi:hypothetical protein